MITKLSHEQDLARQLASFLNQETEVQENQEKLNDLKLNRPVFEAPELNWEELKIAADHEKEIMDLELLIVRQHEQLEKLEKEIAACIPNNLYNKGITIRLCDQQGNCTCNFKLTVISDQEIDVSSSEPNPNS